MEKAILTLTAMSIVNIILPIYPLTKLEKQAVTPYVLYAMLVMMLPAILVYIYFIKAYYQKKYTKKVHTVSMMILFWALGMETASIFIFYLFIDEYLFLLFHAGGIALYVLSGIGMRYHNMNRADLEQIERGMGTIWGGYDGHGGLYPGQKVKVVRRILGGFVVENHNGKEILIDQFDLIHQREFHRLNRISADTSTV
ncbi:hypothetical protein ENBRE01_1933 [Enteropsectra breve]|nr:hypothetical protein ENBRE01_1933 [Enteropsectra breve]